MHQALSSTCHCSKLAAETSHGCKRLINTNNLVSAVICAFLHTGATAVTVQRAALRPPTRCWHCKAHSPGRRYLLRPWLLLVAPTADCRCFYYKLGELSESSKIDNSSSRASAFYVRLLSQGLQGLWHPECLLLGQGAGCRVLLSTFMETYPASLLACASSRSSLAVLPGSPCEVHHICLLGHVWHITGTH
jgi:hypothetical protein